MTCDPLERHAVGPLERDACPNHHVDCLLGELHLDPREVTTVLHLLHLLLCGLVEVRVEFGGMLVVRPPIEVLIMTSRVSAS